MYFSKLLFVTNEETFCLRGVESQQIGSDEIFSSAFCTGVMIAVILLGPRLKICM